MKKGYVFLVGMFLLASCGGSGTGVGTGSTPPTAHAQAFTMCGTQLDAMGNPVAGATVAMVVSSKLFRTATSATGEYSLTIPGLDAANLPDTFTYSVSKDGFIPVTYSRSKTESSCQGSIPLLPLPVVPDDPTIIPLEAEPLTHHLGDSNYSGEINSMFQYLKAQGTSFRKSIEVKNQPNDFPYAYISFMHKGVQYNEGFRDVVRVNGNDLPIANSDPTGQFLPFRQRVSSSLFKANQANEFVIQSDNRGGGDYDDFEFQNVIIEFSKE